MDLSLLLTGEGIPINGIPSPEKAMTYPYTDFERKYILENRKRMIIGTPKSARAQIEQLAKDYQTDEIKLVMSTFHLKDKLTAYELIAKEMKLF